MIDPYLVEGYAIVSADEIMRTRKLRAQREQQEPPKLRSIEPLGGRYTLTPEQARANQRTLREVDELEQKALKLAAVIGVVKNDKLRIKLS